MAKYRKKPVVIEAEPYRFGLEDGFICGSRYIEKHNCSKELESPHYPGYSSLHEIYVKDALENPAPAWKPFIKTLEGKMEVTTSDMIITGVRQERYPCKIEIFHQTYDET